jgi:hypothetical protein
MPRMRKEARIRLTDHESAPLNLHETSYSRLLIPVLPIEYRLLRHHQSMNRVNTQWNPRRKDFDSRGIDPEGTQKAMVEENVFNEIGGGIYET